jgi:hypothetical protein
MAPDQAVPSAPAKHAGRTLGIVGLILGIVGLPLGTALVFGVTGLILCIVAYRKSAQVGFKNSIALAGIIVGAISMVWSVVLLVTVIIPEG